MHVTGRAAVAAVHVTGRSRHAVDVADVAGDVGNVVGVAVDVVDVAGGDYQDLETLDDSKNRSEYIPNSGSPTAMMMLDDSEWNAVSPC